MRFLPGCSGAEIKCTVHVALPKRPINYFEIHLTETTPGTELRAYCSNIYAMAGAVSVGWISNMSALRKVVVVSGEA